MISKNIVLLAVILACLAGGAMFAADTTEKAPDPAATRAKGTEDVTPSLTGEALQLRNHMDKLFQLTKKVNAPKAAEKAEARKSIEDAMDWERVTEVCLGPKEWKKQSATNRATFGNLLKDVIKLTAYGRIDKFWNDVLSYKFVDVTVKGKRAHVASEFVVKDDKYVLEYFMFRKGSRWYVDDIAYEEMKYSENINEQVAAFLKENSFSKLLEKLRKRKAELIDDDKAPKKSS